MIAKDFDKETEETAASKTDVVKSKKLSPKVKKLNKPKATHKEFDWPKKNYFEVSCVAAETNGSVQRMVCLR